MKTFLKLKKVNIILSRFVEKAYIIKIKIFKKYTNNFKVSDNKQCLI